MCFVLALFGLIFYLIGLIMDNIGPKWPGVYEMLIKGNDFGFPL